MVREPPRHPTAEGVDATSSALDHQIDVGSQVGTQINDGIVSGTAGKNFGTVDGNGHSVNLRAADHPKDQIAAKPKIERRGCLVL